MSNILYYSKRCQHSKSIIIHISQSPAKDQIQFVCVDDLIKSGTLPSFVKSVPLIFKRDTNTLLKGDSAIDWIRSFNPPETSGDINGFDSFGSAYSGLSEDGYEGAFSTDDSYSFIDGSNTSNESNLSQSSRCWCIFFRKGQRGCSLERRCALSRNYVFGLCYE